MKSRITCMYLILLIGFFEFEIQAQSNSGPPRGIGPYRENALVELVKLDSTIKLDIRYATINNFAGRAVYAEARAFLQRPAADALLLAHRWLKKQGYGLVIYDAYRPWTVTKLFWDITPPEKRIFVADPSSGSVHNRGCAVDVGLYNLSTGLEVEMTGNYDETSERSFVTFTGGTKEQKANRDLLRKAMEQDGYFFVYPEEWWHYNYRDFRDYAIQDIPFSKIVSQ
jgi:zinc D-Ala-D-Ala dipeptidase